MDYTKRLKAIRNYAEIFKKHATPVNVITSLDLLITLIDSLTKQDEEKLSADDLRDFYWAVEYSKQIVAKQLNNSMFKPDVLSLYDQTLAIIQTWIKKLEEDY